MPLEIKVPSLGQSVPEATVGKWLKKVGEDVAADEAVVELETDKINMEVTAFRGGKLARIDRESGATVAVGETLGVIATEGEEVKSAPAAEGEKPAAEKEQAAEKEPAAEQAAAEEKPAEQAAGQKPEAMPPASRSAAKPAAEAPAEAERPAPERPAAPRGEAVIPEDI